MSLRLRLRSFSRSPRKRLADASGGTAIEYGLLAGLIAVALIAILSTTSGAINRKFNTASQTLDTGR